MKKYALLFLSAVALIVVVSISALSMNSHSFTSLACETESGGAIDKTPCEAVKVKIVFKNTGKTDSAWSVNVAFEGEAWTWKGTSQTLTLKPGKTKILNWNGTIPCNALIDSVARLIVYHNDSFMALDWWIHVISGAELTITSSKVE